MIYQPPPPVRREGEPPGIIVVIIGAIVGAVVGGMLGIGWFHEAWVLLASIGFAEDIAFGAFIGGAVAWPLTSITGEVRKNLRTRRNQ